MGAAVGVDPEGDVAGADPDRARGERDREYMAHQLRELEVAGLRIGEEDELIAERQAMRNAVKIKCEAPAIDERAVRNSGGQVERRYIIETHLMLGDRSWPIELALANRDQMGFRMLLGRTALEGRALIEPGRSFVAGQRPRRARQARPALEPSKALP